jgi:D-sedoheptulose 7-phosphate isomerase
MKELLELIKNARFVFVCGNGGSAATAEHFTNDLFSKGIKAICLNSNTSIMTMIANDFGYEYVFSNQLRVFGTNKDLLITISCSGVSPNILDAIFVAGSIGMKWYEFEVFKKKDRDYGKLEDKHLQLVHKIKDAL